MSIPETVGAETGDALVIIDVQNDFLPGGALPVPAGDEVVAPLNGWLAIFAARALPVFATRDCHPPDHCSFRAQGGPWPRHCVKGSPGADFPIALRLPPVARIIDKPDCADRETYSAFTGTALEAELRAAGVTRLWVGGLATDYCVLNTVLDALRLGFRVLLLVEALRAVDAEPGDGDRAMARMTAEGAIPIGSRHG